MKVLPKIPNCALLKSKANIPLGDMLLEMQRQFPPFNFYYDKPEGMSTNHYLLTRKPVPFNYYFEYGQIKRWFLDVINQAQGFVKPGEIDKAIWIYETLIEHRYPKYKPYDLLIKLYRKQKDFENEQRVLNHSISFFMGLRESQKQYVTSLAREYNVESEAEDYIKAGKKIHYYGGAFVLYDPVKVLGEWADRIRVLNFKKLI